MQLSSAPSKLVLAFANAGGKNTIPVASQIGITPGAASLTDGFPPLTRTPLAGGGVPPSGLDMNGILFELSAIARWINAGAGFTYDGTFANDSNVGGYPKGARIARSDASGYWLNLTDNNTADPEAAGALAAGWIPDGLTGIGTIAMASSNVTLTPLQYGKQVLTLSGTLTANLNLIFPNLPACWVVINNTTGTFSVTAKTAAGTGVTVTQGSASTVAGDGTNILAYGPPGVMLTSALNVLTKQGDQLQIGGDASYLREGACNVTSGDLYTLLGGTLGAQPMKYQTHNFTITAAGMFGPRDETGVGFLKVTIENQQERYYLVASGAAGVAPVAGDFTLKATFDYSTGNFDAVSVSAGGVSLSPGKQLQSIAATVAANALTFTLNATSLDFRSATASSGTVNTRNVASPITLTVPLGATVGTTNGAAGRLVLLAIDNAGTVELAVINAYGGVALDEVGLINTTTIGVGSNSASTFYSATGRTGVPYRVVGYIDITEATAGTWITAPAVIQGQGGHVLTNINAPGFCQTWQNVKTSRALGTTYTNTTGRPITVAIGATTTGAGGHALVVDGVQVSSSPGITGETANHLAIVNPGSTYVMSGSNSTLNVWAELR